MKNKEQESGKVSPAEDIPVATDDSVDTESDLGGGDERLEDERILQESMDEATTDSREMIRIYCQAEAKDMEKSDFSILVDESPDDEPGLTLNIRTAVAAADLIRSLVNRRYAKYGVTLKDNSTGKTIFFVGLVPGWGEWGIGFSSQNEEEIDEWNQRYREYFDAKRRLNKR